MTTGPEPLTTVTPSGAEPPRASVARLRPSVRHVRADQRIALATALRRRLRSGESTPPAATEGAAR